MKVGVFLARMQPMHKAHIWMVEKALEENDKVLVVLGSSNKERTLRNPLPFWLRKQFLEDHIYDSFNEGHLDKLEVIELPD
jgi:cytidyltransferase-like protein